MKASHHAHGASGVSRCSTSPRLPRRTTSIQDVAASIRSPARCDVDPDAAPWKNSRRAKNAIPSYATAVAKKTPRAAETTRASKAISPSMRSALRSSSLNVLIRLP